MKKVKCSFCGGSGIQPRFLQGRCGACKGKGIVEFEGPVIKCSLCAGKGRVRGSLLLTCLRCRGVGVVEENSQEPIRGKGDVRQIHERLGEFKKEMQRKTRLRPVLRDYGGQAKEIEQRLQPAKLSIQEVKENFLWVKEFAKKIQKDWKFLWKK